MKRRNEALKADVLIEYRYRNKYKLQLALFEITAFEIRLALSAGLRVRAAGVMHTKYARMDIQRLESGLSVTSDRGKSLAQLRTYSGRLKPRFSAVLESAP